MLETVDLARPRRRAVFSRLSLALIAAACASCAAAPEAPVPVPVTPVTATPANAATAEQGEELAPVRPEIYAPFRLTADLSALSAEERRMLGLFIDAAQIMDGLFWQQAYGDRDRLLGGLADPAMRRFAEINYGPWDRLDENRSFVPGAGSKPLGARFYPADMSREEFEQAPLPGKDGLYTFITRDPAGKLALLPYGWRFARELQQAAAKLHEAACARAADGVAQPTSTCAPTRSRAMTTAPATWPGST